MITRTNTELNTVVNYAIANNAYTRSSIIECIRASQSSELNTALDCCLDEGTLDDALAFFLDNPNYYPEAQEQNNMHNHHVVQKRAIMLYTYGSTAQVELVPESMIQPVNAGPIHAIAEKLMFS